MLKKVLFLDFDGVLNPTLNMIALHKMWEVSNKQIKSQDEFGNVFFQYNLDCLYKILKQTKCKIVISSAWRYFGLIKIKQMWVKRGYLNVDDIIDITPFENEVMKHENIEFYDSICRGNEIEFWLKKNNFTGNYCIVDDCDDMLYSQKDFFVQTDSRVGLLDSDVVKIVEILNR